MKKLLPILLLLCASAGLRAQVILEHTYPVTATSASNLLSVVYLEGVGHKYRLDAPGAGKIYLYNTDHSLWKTIPMPVSPGSGYNTFGWSTKLFDSDTMVEFLVNDIVSAWLNMRVVYLVKDNGTIVKTFYNAQLNWADYLNPPLRVVNGQWKLLIKDSAVAGSHQQDNVYALPGNFIPLKAPMGSDLNGAEASLYPNPMSRSTVLHYALPAGLNSAQLSIYDISGKLHRTYTITNQFKDLIIERGTLSSGTYLYEISGAGYANTGGRFVVE